MKNGNLSKIEGSEKPVMRERNSLDVWKYNLNGG